MGKFIRRLLNLQPGEGRTIGVLYLLGFVVATSLVWGGAIGRGLFLKRIGIDWLPLMFVFDALLTLPITVIYAAVVDRVSNARLLAAIFGGAALVLLAGWGLLMLDQWVVDIPYVIAVYALFYLGERLLRALFAVHVWTFFNDYLDIRAAKRAFPILGSTSRVAGILSGSAVALLAGFLPARDLVLAWVGVLALGFWLSLRTPRWLAAKSGAGAPQAGPRRSALGAFGHNLREGFRFVSSSSFLRWLAVGAFAMTALLVLMDYQAQRVFDQAYATAEDLVGFYGLLETVINLIALPVQMFLISRLVSWLGVAQVNLFFPIGSLLIYGALSWRPSLPTAMAGQFGRDTFRSSVQVPVDNMLYNAVPLPVKGRARAFVKGLLLPLATVAVGLMLLPVQGMGDLPWWIVGVGGAAAVVQLLAALMVRRRYTQALVAMLAEEDFSAYRLAGAGEVSTLVGPPDPATFRRLIQHLWDSQDEDTRLFLARVVAEVGGREAEAPLLEVAAAAGPVVQAGIFETLIETETAGPATLDLARELLQGRRPRLRRAALTILERLMGAGDPDLWALAAPLLDDPDPGVRAQAVLLLVRCGDIFYVAEAVRALQELLADGTQPAHRVAGIRVLKQMGDARMVRNLIPYLDDGDDAVRLQAAGAIESLADPQAPDWALDLARDAVARGLADPAEGVRLSALRALGKVGGEGALDRLLAALGDPSNLVRDQAGLGLLAMGAGAAPVLDSLVRDQSAAERLRQAAAVVLGQMARDRVLAGSQAHQALQRAEDLMEETLRLIYADARLVAALHDPAALADLASLDAPATREPAGPPDEEEDAGPRSRTGGEAPAGLDALLPPGVGRRRQEHPEREAEGELGLDALLPPGVGRRRKSQSESVEKGRGRSGLDALLPAGAGRRGSRRSTGAALSGGDPAPPARLLGEGLRQRNERRLDAVFSL
ncbi:MAG: HEAT repeat domain-containing protein, partial [Anaerolineae bacterium]